MKHTKIICTIGPASEKPAVLEKMITGGMDIARLNFSHGSHADHAKLLKNIRVAARKTKKIVSIFADLQGPKIRAGSLPDAGVALKTGETAVFTTSRMSFPTRPDKSGRNIRESSLLKIPVTYEKMHKDVKAGERMLLDDGLLEVEIIKVSGRDIYVKIKNGGVLTSHKGINLPDSKIRASSLTTKDKDDLFFAMKNGVDYIALSFAREKKDVRELRGLIKKNAKKLKIREPQIIVKIEKPEALENFVSILEASDAIMVARGDLAIETPAEDVPLRQKEMVALCRQAAKPVIVATQMLDSMIRNPRPTRAEISDVAGAVMDNVDAVMLSGESATGKYPVEAVKEMNKIIMETEASPYDDVLAIPDGNERGAAARGKAAAILAREKNIKQIIDLSEEGVFRFISKWRPEADIFVKTDEHNLYPNLFWGAHSFSCRSSDPKAALNKLKFKSKTIAVLENEIKII